MQMTIPSCLILRRRPSESDEAALLAKHWEPCDRDVTQMLQVDLCVPTIVSLLLFTIAIQIGVSFAG